MPCFYITHLDIFVNYKCAVTMDNKLTYESLKAEQAWLVVSEQLQQRNALLSMGINHLEKLPGDLPIASRLMVLRYHLRTSLRKLTSDARRSTTDGTSVEQLRMQWQQIHQLFFLLRQIDAELENATTDCDSFRLWLDSRPQRVYKSALIHLN